jgi:hypothetical protein
VTSDSTEELGVWREPLPLLAPVQRLAFLLGQHPRSLSALEPTSSVCPDLEGTQYGQTPRLSDRAGTNLYFPKVALAEEVLFWGLPHS